LKLSQFKARRLKAREARPENEVVVNLRIVVEVPVASTFLRGSYKE